MGVGSWEASSMKPDGDICFTRFEGWLKQHKPDALSEAQKFLLGVALPGFLDTEETRTARTLTLTPGEAGPDAALDPDHPARREYVMAKPYRRFAGDETLS